MTSFRMNRRQFTLGSIATAAAAAVLPGAGALPAAAQTGANELKICFWVPAGAGGGRSPYTYAPDTITLTGDSGNVYEFGPENREVNTFHITVPEEGWFTLTCSQHGDMAPQAIGAEPKANAESSSGGMGRDQDFRIYSDSAGATIVEVTWGGTDRGDIQRPTTPEENVSFGISAGWNFGEKPIVFDEALPAPTPQPTEIIGEPMMGYDYEMGAMRLHVLKMAEGQYPALGSEEQSLAADDAMRVLFTGGWDANTSLSKVTQDADGSFLVEGPVGLAVLSGFLPESTTVATTNGVPFEDHITFAITAGEVIDAYVIYGWQ